MEESDKEKNRCFIFVYKNMLYQIASRHGLRKKISLNLEKQNIKECFNVLNKNTLKNCNHPPQHIWSHVINTCFIWIQFFH